MRHDGVHGVEDGLRAGDVRAVEAERGAERLVVPPRLRQSEEVALDDRHEDHGVDERPVVLEVGGVAGRVGREVAPARAQRGGEPDAGVDRPRVRGRTRRDVPAAQRAGEMEGLDVGEAQMVDLVALEIGAHGGGVAEHEVPVSGVVRCMDVRGSRNVRSRSMRRPCVPAGASPRRAVRLSDARPRRERRVRRSASPEAISSFARSTSPAPPTESIPRTRPSSRYQIANAPSVERAADDLLVPRRRRPDVLERGPVGEVGEEVRDHVVRRVGAEHVARGRRALGGGDLLVLDAHDAAVDDAVVLADVAGGEDPLGRRPQAAVAAHAAEVAERQPGAPREHDVGLGADAADDRVRLDRAAAAR